MRDKYESELKEVEKTERETMERYNNIKAKYNELEGDNERMKVVVRQREKDLEGIKKLTDVLQEERNRLADVIRQEFSDRIVFTEEENKRIKLEMAENKSRHQYELDKKKDEFEKVQKEKTDELNTVHEKYDTFFLFASFKCLILFYLKFIELNKLCQRRMKHLISLNHSTKLHVKEQIILRVYWNSKEH